MKKVKISFVLLAMILVILSGCSTETQQNKSTGNSSTKSSSQSSNLCANGHSVSIGKCPRCGAIVNESEYNNVKNLASRASSVQYSNLQDALLAFQDSDYSGNTEAVNLAKCFSDIKATISEAKGISSKYSELDELTSLLDDYSSKLNAFEDSIPIGNNLTATSLQVFFDAMDACDASRSSIDTYCTTH